MELLEQHPVIGMWCFIAWLVGGVCGAILMGLCWQMRADGLRAAASAKRREKRKRRKERRKAMPAREPQHNFTVDRPNL